MNEAIPYHERLLELLPLLNRQTELQEILRLVAGEMMTLLRPDAATIQLINPSTQETVRTVFRQGIDEGNPLMNLAKTVISGWVFKYNKTFQSDNFMADRRFTGTDWSALAMRSVICTPMRLGDGFVGALFVFYTAKAAFRETEVARLERLADLVSPYFRHVQDLTVLFQTSLPDSALLKKYEAATLLGKSAPFLELLYSLEAASQCDVRVLLEGESGTGKERVARAIHRYSSRQSGPFVALDCGALPAHLIESELFGHTRGAFTGADRDKKGLIEVAEGGILFLDEISNLPLEVQSKLLRVLQENEIRPVGSSKSRRVDVRFIAAASSSLRDQVANGHFREDLFYRLYVYPIRIPNLAERAEDIPLLALHFMKRFSGEQKKSVKSLSRPMIQFLKGRSWRGNIRELENFIERMVTVIPADGLVLDVSHLPREFEEEANSASLVAKTKVSLRKRLQIAERDILTAALEKVEWNQSAAARTLGITEQVMRYRMKRLNVSRF
ncbi:sigma-54-dependent Fis family transcriptional regulator [candidate division KSB1 bacterium]|nr:sigma-54-dependent Fis family transcriptional regulator [candidate division KSB1 bacterium]